MASTIWKGYITFGLISVPIRLFAAARGERVSFNQIHDKCNSRIRMQTYCPTCDRTVERSELVKGYEIEKDQYIIVEDEEIKKIAPQSSETMEIQEFVKLADVDPIYFDTSYYAVPEAPGRKAYKLLVETMQQTGYVAVAKIAMHQREYTVVIRPHAQGLTLHTIYYANEVREVAEYGKDSGVEVKPQEVQLAQQLVMSLAAEFEPEKYKDDYQERLIQLIEAKGEGRMVQATPQKRLAPVIDLMEALQKSLGQKESEKKPAATAETQAQPKSRRPRPATRAAGD
jgi:DNA end-binding protein Ku